MMKTILTTISFLITNAAIALAQAPPMLPSDPAQAPVDGGLSLVALAGGAYAWKKLRAKQQNS